VQISKVYEPGSDPELLETKLGEFILNKDNQYAIAADLQEN